MRKIDKEKTSFEKAIKTINFDFLVLKALEKRAQNTGSSVSNIVNDLCRRHVVGDEAFYIEMQKNHLEKAMGYQFLKEQIQIKKEASKDL